MMSNSQHVKNVVEELEEKGVYDFFDGEEGAEIYDIEYTVGAHLDYLGTRAAIALGGPNVCIDSRDGSVDLYWGNEEAHWYMSDDCKIDVDAYFKDMFNAARG